MVNKVYVIGVGMTKFEKPGRREGWDYPDMARESGAKALQDAGIDYRAVEQGSNRFKSAMCTANRRPASGRSTNWASPAFPSSTSTTTAQPGRPRFTLLRKRFGVGWPTAPSRS